MELVNAINRSRYGVFKWRYELTLAKKLALALGMACLIGVLAQVRLYTPWSPVPITGQTFAVLFAGILLGSRCGAASVLIYFAAGAFGIPWFAGWSGGAAILMGPTAGYIAGFIRSKEE